MINLLKLVLSAGCGLAGVGAIILYGVQEKWLSLGLFSTMTPEQTYKAFLFSVAVMFGTFVLLVLVHLASKKTPSVSATAHGAGHAINTTGKNSGVNINK